MGSCFVVRLIPLWLCICAVSESRSESVNVGVVLGFDSWVGRVANTCISMALHDFYMDHPNYFTRLSLYIRDSDLDVVGAASAALDLMKNMEVQAILGPQTSAEAKFLADLANKSHVPILSFSATSPFSSTSTPYFVRATLNDSAQAKPIASLLEAYKWRQAVAIYEDTEYGASFIPYLSDAVLDVGSRIQQRTVLPSSASDEFIKEELYKLMTMQTRVFIVHMSSPLASRLFQMAQMIDMMSEDYAWIITDGLVSLLNSMDRSTIDSMQGVLGVTGYIEKSERLDNFTARWKRNHREVYPNEIELPDLNVFALRAYDATWTLALAVEKSGTRALNYWQASAIKLTGNSTELSNLGISLAGPRLLKAILKTQFQGLTGHIRFINGELQATTFQIINIVGKGTREIGFWSPEFGLSRTLNKQTLQREKGYTAAMADLRAVIWPGESTSVPKGWVFPTNGAKLKIGVPVKSGFKEFVKVERDPGNNKTKVTGFSIDVFTAVVEALPYALPYEFVPFEDGEGRSAGTYNELVYQVYLGTYDAVVGDVTINANRSKYVDFTPPYTESGISLLVPLKKESGSKALAFLKPLTWELWFLITVFFFIIPSVVWVLEHGINTAFRRPWKEQLGNVLYFSFSMLVFAHRDHITSNLSRFILITWLFLLLILSSSYTANLSSILTVEQLKPTVTDVNTLLKNGECVGHQNGSFVKGSLMNLGFPESRLKAYCTADEYAEALFNGSVGAIVGSTPIIKVFLSYYHDKFTMVGLTFRTGGFGFVGSLSFSRGQGFYDFGMVLPKNSLLLSDISEAILNVTEGDKMTSLERALYGYHSSPSTASRGLGLDCFWVLFLIIGMTCIGAIFIRFSICNWNKNHNGVSDTAEPRKCLWRRFKDVAVGFSKRDHSSVLPTRERSAREIEIGGDESTPPRSSSASEDDASAIALPTPMNYTDGGNALDQGRGALGS
ncbi:glutamate receptor 2.1 [Amborella trichopoda]|nr:glutamate receptor 2.1 [Amborella trichopoda]|eukprot:XP_006845559.2 glutamate receptor 2.1 [Amborella trichopoda]